MKGAAQLSERIGLDQRPRPVTDCRIGLAAFDELADEGDRVGVNPEMVGIHRAAREKQGVIVGDRGVRDQPVNGERACCIHIVLTRPNLTVMDRQHLGLCASPLQKRRTGTG